MPKKRIAIDMDEVMTDSIGRFIQIYQEEYNEDLSDLRLPGRTLRNTVPPDRLEAVLQYPHRAEFFKDLPIKEGCAEVMRYTKSTRYLLLRRLWSLSFALLISLTG
jgi:5'-nucleotidase